MELDPYEHIWRDLCCGTRCFLCERVQEPRASLEFRYCATCAPDSEHPPHAVYLFVDHGGGWSVTLASLEERQVVYWMPGLTMDQLRTVVRRGRSGRHQLRQYLLGIRQWQRSGLYLHLDDAQYASLIARGATTRTPATRRRTACRSRRLL